MGRYGTVMIGRLAAPAADVEKLARDWADERKVPGFQHEDLMVCDDGKTVVMSVIFESEASYKALADDPAQSRWYEEKLAPLLDGDPQWLDGRWAYSADAMA
jgi:hypothetical protein